MFSVVVVSPMQTGLAFDAGADDEVRVQKMPSGTVIGSDNGAIRNGGRLAGSDGALSTGLNFSQIRRR